MKDTRLRCRKCNVPITNSKGQPYTSKDSIEKELCQWCNR